MTVVSRRGFLGRLLGVAATATVGPQIIDHMEGILIPSRPRRRNYGPQNVVRLSELSDALKTSYPTKFFNAMLMEETPFRKALGHL